MNVVGCARCANIQCGRVWASIRVPCTACTTWVFVEVEPHVIAHTYTNWEVGSRVHLHWRRNVKNVQSRFLRPFPRASSAPSRQFLYSELLYGEIFSEQGNCASSSTSLFVLPTRGVWNLRWTVLHHTSMCMWVRVSYDPRPTQFAFASLMLCSSSLFLTHFPEGNEFEFAVITP